jgi:2,4-dienoyl-CoA reductase-like NADH-dependent reductase (Old Yellow Enzyme family)/thioredoxin reductase
MSKMRNKVYFKKLFEPGKTGTLEIKNRIVMAPMGNQLYNKDGFVTEQLKGYYEARAKGGTGLIMTSALSISFPIGSGRKAPGRVDDDRFIPGLGELVQVVHKHGTRVVAQLLHMGPADAFPIADPSLQPLAASPIARQPDYTHPKSSIVRYSLPREMTVSEIAETTLRWADAATRAKRAGFDGVEIHAANRYLLNSFLSPAWNRRRDEYGGGLKNRARFLVEVIRAVRRAVGDDYPIWCRINGEERDVDGGITIAMVRELAPMIEQAGLDAIDVSSMYPHSPGYPPGFNVKAAAAVKQIVGIPVVVAGRLNPTLGEKTLRDKKADFICIGRPLIADPELPNKAAEGRLDDIAPCVYCLNCLALDRKCTVNASRAREREYEIRPAEKPRKVLVAGGGPGGMEAARVAALRGHRVILYEKEQKLGGQLILASLLRREIEPLLRYLKGQMKKLGVEVVTGKTVDSALIDVVKPDVVVVAAGASSVLPDVKGVPRDNVLSSGDVEAMMRGRLRRNEEGKTSPRRLLWFLGLNLARVPFGWSLLWRLLNVWAPFGKRVVVVGKGMSGIEIADFLAQRGKKITIVDKRETLPFDIPPMPVLRQYMESRLQETGATFTTAISYEWVTDKGITIINTQQQLQSLEADTIVFAADYKPNTELFQALRRLPVEIHLVGDCSEPIGISEAIHDGSRVGREI